MPIGPLSPGVYTEEVPGGAKPITGISTSETAFVDYFASGPMDEAERVESYADFERLFGGLVAEGGPDARIGVDARSEASYAIQQYFLNGGSVAWIVRVAGVHEPQSPEWIDGEGADAILGRSGERKGIYALKETGFNILCLPATVNLSPANLKSVYDEAAKFCDGEKAFLIMDIPPHVDTSAKMAEWLSSANPDAITRSKNAAVYFPRVTVADPLNNNLPRNVGPSGAMAGLYARTDAERGVWKAPAGFEAELIRVNIVGTITDADSNVLNPLGINVLRNFPAAGNVSWGARTLEGADGLASDWKYIPVRRTALYLERSIDEGLKWVVSELNDETLWAKIRVNVGAFMQGLFRRAAFQGRTPKEAFFVKCDSETTTQRDIDLGIMNILVGFAPLKPAEFVVIKIQQMIGHIRS